MSNAPYVLKGARWGYRMGNAEAVDSMPRAGTTVETLAALKAAFTKDGSVTAGNASGVSDGAASLCIGGGMGTAMVIEVA